MCEIPRPVVVYITVHDHGRCESYDANLGRKKVPALVEFVVRTLMFRVIVRRIPEAGSKAVPPA